MQNIKFKELFNFDKKSKIKAGDGFKLGEGKYPFYTSSNVLSKSIDEFLFEKESLILGTGGLASIHYCNEKFAVSTDCFVTQPKNSKQVFPKYVYYYLSGNIHILENGFKGAGLKHISKDYLENIEIPVIDLPIQQKIANILDKADEIRRYNKELIEKYDALTQSLFLDMFGEYINDKSCYIEIEKIANFIDYRGKTQTKVKSGIPLISATSVRSGFLDKTRLDYITEETYSKVMTRGFPKIGDVLFTTEGATMGFTCRIPEGFDRFAVGQRLITLQETVNYNSYVLEFMINSSSVQKVIFNLATGSAVKGISSAKFSRIKVPNPPLKIQVEFKNRIRLIETQKQQAQEALVKSENLFQGLLQQVFKGKLN